MAKDDFFVIAYRILSYLYECMKKGDAYDPDVISPEALGINSRYFKAVVKNLYWKGFIIGITETSAPVWHRDYMEIKSLEITMDGVEYLQNNSTIAKAKQALKDFKDMIPGL